MRGLRGRLAPAFLRALGFSMLYYLVYVWAAPSLVRASAVPPEALWRQAYWLAVLVAVSVAYEALRVNPVSLVLKALARLIVLLAFLEVVGGGKLPVSVGGVRGYVDASFLVYAIVLATVAYTVADIASSIPDMARWRG